MECVIITPAPLLATVPRQDTRGTFAKMVSRIIIIMMIIIIIIIIIIITIIIIIVIIIIIIKTFKLF